MVNDFLIKQLEEIVNLGLESVHIPYQKGNSIRIGDYVVRISTKGFLVYNIKKNSQVAKTNFKISALAAAKTSVENKKDLYEILRLDQRLLKHYNDAVFYKHSLKTATDSFRRDVIKTRLDISIQESRKINRQLCDFIF